MISGAFIYKLLPTPEEGPQIDEIRTRMAASRSRPEDVRPAVQHVVREWPRTGETPKEEIHTISESAVTEEFLPENTDIARVEEVPWEDLKAGWRSDLKDFLIDSDPFRGEEIYSAYLEEAESFEAEIDALSKEADKAGNESKQDFETLIGQLEVRHEEKLKEIFGSYYSEVTDRHQQYNSSIQYQNRSEADVVGVAL